jgi:8-oxo-dGTP pyrophosphatase MutT (NUDIX family)
MRIKILSFITYNNKFLLLRNGPTDPIHGWDRWSTVTGSVEENETLEEAVAREIKEETNLDVAKTISLSSFSEYYSEFDKEMCKEHNFISIVKNDQVTLDNIENIEYEWVPIDEYVERIWWDEKEQLKKDLLEKLK